MPRSPLPCLAILGCVITLTGAPLAAQQVIVPEDPISEAPIALQEMRAGYPRLSKATPDQLQEYLDRVDKLQKAAEAYAQTGKSLQASLYYSQALEGISKLSTSRPQWKPEEMQQQKSVIQSAIAALPPTTPSSADETATIALLADQVSDGKLALSWSLHAVNLSADEAARHLDVSVSYDSLPAKQRKARLLANQVSPDPSGESGRFAVRQEFACPAGVTKASIRADFFDQDLFTESRALVRGTEEASNRQTPKSAD
ncbi:hypothetical protein TSACC_1109 [Terrimicrobium sacchariphilum]|uniref:Uncharacterized protein n=1 Tax=Terrimicrobium sacchariphilum TaxID=690879 RepID=A0A146G0Z9_TERSA|nr:hypothetical protein [Terrimicrobium sacchariphilum]GAT31559.1 hypothetical protein TSACC_1109 [Terrimicrobium sacchariphilum]